MPHHARPPVRPPARRRPAAALAGAAAVTALALLSVVAARDGRPGAAAPARAADGLTAAHWGGAVTGVDAEGAVAALTIGTQLAIADVSDVADGADRAAPRIVGRSDPVDDLLTHPHRVGDHVVAMGAWRGLFVFDAADPTAPVERARAATLGEATDLAVAGRRALLCDSKGGLRVFDVGVDGRPVEWGRWLPADGREVVAAAPAGDLAFVVVEDDPARLVAVDFGGAAPAVLGEAALPSEGARDIVVDGDVAFVALGDGVVAVDVADPAAPAVIDGPQPDTGTVEALVAQGGLLWAAGSDFVWVLDARSPEWLTVEAVFEVENLRVGLDVDGARAYLADAEGLRVVAVGDVLADPVIGREAPASGVPLNHGPLDVARHGDHLVVASNRAGLRILDASDPTTATAVAVLAPAVGTSALTRTWRVAVDGDRAYTTEGALGGGVRVVDLADPAQPRVLGEVGAPGVAGRPAVAGDLVAVPTAGSETGGVHLYRVGADGTPSALGRLAFEDAIEVAAIDGDRLYLGGFDVLAVVDIADPAAPVLLGQLDGLDAAGGLVVVAPDRLIVGDVNFGLVEVDVADAAAPAVVARHALAGGASHVVRDGDALWVANNFAGVTRVALAPNQPLRETGRWLVDEAAFALSAAGDAVWVVTNEDRLLAVDPAAETAAHEIGRLDAPGLLVAAAIDAGRIAVVSSWNVDRRSLHVLDTAPALAPRGGGALGNLAPFNTPGDAVALAGDVAWVPGGGRGLVAFDVADAERPRRLTAPRRGAVPRAEVIDIVAAFDVEGARAVGVTVADLVAYDLSDPVRPVVTARHRLPGGIAAALDGDVAWMLVADSTNDGFALVGVDLSNPAAPVEAGRWPLPGDAYDLAAADGQLVVGTADDGLLVWDVTRPTAAHQRAAVPFDGPVEAVALDGGLAWAAEAYGPGYRVHAVDLWAAGGPASLASAEVPDWAAIDLAAEGRQAAVANGHAGLTALRYDGPLGTAPTPSPTAAPRTRPLYLPAVIVQRATAQAVLAVDRSAAMAWPSAPDQPARLDVARAVAGALADRVLRTTAAVTVIAYSQQAERLPSLGPAVVAAALGRLRIDLAVADARHDVMLAAAAAALPAGALAPGCAVVLVVTAGAQPPPDSAAVAQGRAAALRDRGAEIAVVTVGPWRVQPAWWAALAGGDDRVHSAAGAADAAAIADPLAARLAACR